ASGLAGCDGPGAAGAPASRTADAEPAADDAADAAVGPIAAADVRVPGRNDGASGAAAIRATEPESGNAIAVWSAGPAGRTAGPAARQPAGAGTGTRRGPARPRSTAWAGTGPRSGTG